MSEAIAPALPAPARLSASPRQASAEDAGGRFESALHGARSSTQPVAGRDGAADKRDAEDDAGQSATEARPPHEERTRSALDALRNALAGLQRDANNSDTPGKRTPREDGSPRAAAGTSKSGGKAGSAGEDADADRAGLDTESSKGDEATKDAAETVPALPLAHAAQPSRKDADATATEGGGKDGQLTRGKTETDTAARQQARHTQSEQAAADDRTRASVNHASSVDAATEEMVARSAEGKAKPAKDRQTGHADGAGPQGREVAKADSSQTGTTPAHAASPRPDNAPAGTGGAPGRHAASTHGGDKNDATAGGGLDRRTEDHVKPTVHRDGSATMRVVDVQTTPAMSAPGMSPASSAVFSSIKAEAAANPAFVPAPASDQACPEAVHTLKIELTPASLGMVTARLRLVGEQLHVDLQVQSADAHHRLKSDSDAIVKSLQAAGFDVDKVTVQQTHAGTAAGNQPQQPAASGRDTSFQQQAAGNQGGSGSGGNSGSAGNGGQHGHEAPSRNGERAGDPTHGDGGSLFI